MKKILMLMCLLSASEFFGEEVFISSVPVYYENSITGDMCKVDLEVYASKVGTPATEKREYYTLFLNSQYAIQNHSVMLACFDDILRQGLAKYKEWQDIAVKNNVKDYQKEVTNLVLDYVNDLTWSIQAADVPLKLVFTVVNGKGWLDFVFTKTKSENGFMSVNPPTFSLNYDSAIKLQQIIQPDNLKKIIEETKGKKEKLDTLFN